MAKPPPDHLGRTAGVEPRVASLVRRHHYDGQPPATTASLVWLICVREPHGVDIGLERDQVPETWPGVGRVADASKSPIPVSPEIRRRSFLARCLAFRLRPQLPPTTLDRDERLESGIVDYGRARPGDVHILVHMLAYLVSEPLRIPRENLVVSRSRQRGQDLNGLAGPPAVFAQKPRELVQRAIPYRPVKMVQLEPGFTVPDADLHVHEIQALRHPGQLTGIPPDPVVGR